MLSLFVSVGVCPCMYVWCEHVCVYVYACAYLCVYVSLCVCARVCVHGGDWA